MLPHPEFTFRRKESVKADLPARSIPIIEKTERWAVLTAILLKLGCDEADVAAWVAGSPLVAVVLGEG